MKSMLELLLKPIKKLYFMTIIFISVLFFVIYNFFILPNNKRDYEILLEQKVKIIEDFLLDKTLLLKRYTLNLKEEATILENLDLLNSYNQIYQEFESVGIVDSKGYLVLASGQSFSIKDRKYYNKLIEQNKDYIYSNLIKSLENDEEIIIILIRIPNSDLIISGAINVDKVNSSLKKHILKDTSFAIINENKEHLLGSKIDTSQYNFSLTRELNIYKDWSIVIYVNSLIYSNITFHTLIIMIILVSVILVFAEKNLKKIINKTINPIDRLSNNMINYKPGIKQEVINSDIREVVRLNISYQKMIELIDRLFIENEIAINKQRDSEYKSHLEQIKPHFLYNMLETIQVLIFTGKVEKAEEAIITLGKYFRLSLMDSTKMIRLDEEILRIKEYINLLKIRYDDLLIEINDNTDHNIQILRFSLQPLVENAVKYGYKEESNNIIKIDISNDDSYVYAKIKNPILDYKLTKQRLELLFTNIDNDNLETSGLKNVIKRLKLNYKQDCLKYKLDKTSITIYVNYPINYGGNSENINS